jgi:5-oxoprolinase (ATP-hydrolysing)
MSQWNFWINRGGTFTDVIGRHPQGGLLRAHRAARNSTALPGYILL